jgi:hypothetical protein
VGTVVLANYMGRRENQSVSRTDEACTFAVTTSVDCHHGGAESGARLPLSQGLGVGEGNRDKR